MNLELSKDELDFLKSVLTNVVPNMQVLAKDAPGILNMCKLILDKMDKDPTQSE